MSIQKTFLASLMFLSYVTANQLAASQHSSRGNTRGDGVVATSQTVGHVGEKPESGAIGNSAKFRFSPKDNVIIHMKRQNTPGQEWALINQAINVPSPAGTPYRGYQPSAAQGVGTGFTEDHALDLLNSVMANYDTAGGGNRVTGSWYNTNGDQAVITVNRNAGPINAINRDVFDDFVAGTIERIFNGGNLGFWIQQLRHNEPDSNGNFAPVTDLDLIYQWIPADQQPPSNGTPPAPPGEPIPVPPPPPPISPYNPYVPGLPYVPPKK